MPMPTLSDIHKTVYTKLRTFNFASSVRKVRICEIQLTADKTSVQRLSIMSAKRIIPRLARQRNEKILKWRRMKEKNTKIRFYITIPKITSGAMVISVTAQSPARISFKLAPNRYVDNQETVVGAVLQLDDLNFGILGVVFLQVGQELFIITGVDGR